ncbi:hypothetical protein T06_12152 [Trichinella sp. T6]|nr:hypothetical protein T06_12152 [Trichinella sp. T6]
MNEMSTQSAVGHRDDHDHDDIITSISVDEASFQKISAAAKRRLRFVAAVAAASRPRPRPPPQPRLPGNDWPSKGSSRRPSSEAGQIAGGSRRGRGHAGVPYSAADRLGYGVVGAGRGIRRRTANQFVAIVGTANCVVVVVGGSGSGGIGSWADAGEATDRWRAVRIHGHVAGDTGSCTTNVRWWNNARVQTAHASTDTTAHASGIQHGRHGSRRRRLQVHQRRHDKRTVLYLAVNFLFLLQGAHESLLEAARVFGFEQLTLVGANALFASNAAEVDLPAGREVDKTLRAAERGLHFGLLERKSRDGGHVYRLGIFLLFWRCRRELTVPLFDRHHALDHLVQTEQVQKVGLVGIRDEIHFRRRRLGRRYLKQGLFELFAQGELGRGAALGRRLATVNEAGLLGSLSGRCLGGGLCCRHALSLNTGNAGSRVFGRGRTELTAGSREIRHALGASADHFHGTAVLLHRRRRGSSSGGRGRCGRMA